MDAVPFENVTSPVGVPPVEETFAVKVRFIPLPAVLFEADKVVVLVTEGLSTVKTADVFA